jgi:3' terminal RNA ribose 2'-O-methyltransferase Hen1
MLLTITTTHNPATDLGYLLHKHPGRAQSFDLAFGRAHVFYPEATAQRCTAALLLDVDPVALVRGARGEGRSMEQYVNDRPYVASSFLSVAISQVLGTALSGRCKERPEAAAAALPLRARVAPLPCRGGEGFLRRLFEPLGYEVTAEGGPLDGRFPEWGPSPYFHVTLEGERRLSELLSHLYVLIPVLDDEKHYWVGDEEVEKLLRHGEGWLGAHPEREAIAHRYLKRQPSLAREALGRMFKEEDAPPPGDEEPQDAQEASVERPLRLNDQRLGSVVAVLKGVGARRVLDLGCGEGQLIRRLLADPSFEEIVGVDVSPRALERARDRLRLDRLPDRQRERVRLMQGSLTYRDERLAGYDAAAVVEVIEHLDTPRLPAFERALWEFARPRAVALTTPNAEYNVRWETLPAGRFRHHDHRFEWTRERFRAWAEGVAGRFGYAVRYLPVGPEDPEVGPPTQLAVFELRDSAPAGDGVRPARYRGGRKDRPRGGTGAHNCPTLGPPRREGRSGSGRGLSFCRPRWDRGTQGLASPADGVQCPSASAPRLPAGRPGSSRRLVCGGEARPRPWPGPERRRADTVPPSVARRTPVRRPAALGRHWRREPGTVGALSCREAYTQPEET